MFKRALILLSLLLLSSTAFAQHHTEKFYQEATCSQLNGKMEVISESKTRCDCLTPQYAIEYDFAHKWAESIGQSLDYAARFHSSPGIVLILEEPKDDHFLQELLYVNDKNHLGITIWTVDQNLQLFQRN